MMDLKKGGEGSHLINTASFLSKLLVFHLIDVLTLLRYLPDMDDS
jgi:hypothetical protein